jgi:hypothetical protein
VEHCSDAPIARLLDPELFVQIDAGRQVDIAAVKVIPDKPERIGFLVHGMVRGDAAGNGIDPGRHLGLAPERRKAFHDLDPDLLGRIPRSLLVHDHPAANGRDEPSVLPRDVVEGKIILGFSDLRVHAVRACEL